MTTATTQDRLHGFVAQGDTLIDVRNLKVYFPVTAGLIFQRKIADVKAVDGVSFQIRKGETLGLVGESGCGKSTTGRAILQLYRPTEGEIRFGEVELTQLKGGDLRRMRRSMQMIFQDPFASLNPRMSVGAIIGEPLAIHGLAKGQARRERVARGLFGRPEGLTSPFGQAAAHDELQGVDVGRGLYVHHERIGHDGLPQGPYERTSGVRGTARHFLGVSALSRHPGRRGRRSTRLPGV